MCLVGAFLAGGGGDDEVEREFAVFHSLNHRVFSNAGGTGDDDQQGIGFAEIEFRHVGNCTKPPLAEPMPDSVK